MRPESGSNCPARPWRTGWPRRPICSSTAWGWVRARSPRYGCRRTGRLRQSCSAAGRPGLTVDLAGSGTADVAFVTAEVDPRPAADETYALSLGPDWACRSGPARRPARVDFTLEVRGYGDQFPGNSAAPGQAALDGRTHAELLASWRRAGAAAGRAGAHRRRRRPRPVGPGWWRPWPPEPRSSCAAISTRPNSPTRLDAERAQPWPPHHSPHRTDGPRKGCAGPYPWPSARLTSRADVDHVFDSA